MPTSSADIVTQSKKPPDEARIAAKLRFEEDSVRECSNDTLVLIRQQQWRDRLIQCSGSQPQPGRETGVAMQLQDTFPWLVSVTCAPHRLALCCKDASSGVAYMDYFRDILQQLHLYLRNSANGTAGLWAPAECLGMDNLKVKLDPDLDNPAGLRAYNIVHEEERNKRGRHEEGLTRDELWAQFRSQAARPLDPSLGVTQIRGSLLLQLLHRTPRLWHLHYKNSSEFALEEIAGKGQRRLKSYQLGKTVSFDFDLMSQ
eukprot:superscaffoldBa00000023_g453